MEELSLCEKVLLFFILYNISKKLTFDNIDIEDRKFSYSSFWQKGFNCFIG